MADTNPSKLVIVGLSSIAEVAYEYFTHDSLYEVVAFSVEEAYVERPTLFDIPILPFENITDTHDPREYAMFVAVGYGKLNRLRARMVADARAKGYRLASYVSTEAFIWRNVTIGDNCFILEHNVIQPFVTIGNNVTLWSGNHIGHHSRILDHTFIASHAVISGHVEIGEHCFIGVNATIANNVTVKPDCVIGAGALVMHDTADAAIIAPRQTAPRAISALEHFGVVRESS